jgi:hypothetical protein
MYCILGLTAGFIICRSRNESDKTSCHVPGSDRFALNLK